MRSTARFSRLGHSSTRGAATVEMAVAIMPLLITFFSFVQVGKMMTAQIMMQHAAQMAARAATVIHKGKNPRASGNDSEVTAAAKAGLGSWTEVLDVQASVGGGGGVHDLVTAEVSGTYKCDVPLGKLIVCGGGSHSMKPVRVSLPLQGADYAEE
jgi:Flp pilus assembly protein TadG